MGTVEQEGVSACRRCHDALQPGASRTSVSSGPAAASVPWRRAGSGARARPPQPRARLRFSVPLLGIPYGCPAASQITIKLPHFKVSCCPLTSLSASPFPPRPFPLPHLHKWLPGPAGFSGGPSSRSLLQFSAPSSKDPSRVLIPRGSDLGRIPGSSPHHGVPPLPDSGESGNKPILVPFLPSQGGKHTSGILFLFTRAIRSGRDLRIRAVSFLLPPSLPPSLPSPEVAFLLVSTMS